jgi:hypothetical protein
LLLVLVVLVLVAQIQVLMEVMVRTRAFIQQRLRCGQQVVEVVVQEAVIHMPVPMDFLEVQVAVVDKIILVVVLQALVV